MKKLDRINRSDGYYIHTHGILDFKRCRRKWYISSPFGMFKKPKQIKDLISPYLWQGSGFHFALEDYHGHNNFGCPIEALKAYVECHLDSERPVEWESILENSIDMLNIYKEWHENMKIDHEYKTAYIGGKPAVELNFALELENIRFNDLPVYFGGTIDRLVQDKEGKYWILDYKTAKVFDTSKLPLDTQITAYCWAAEQYLDIPIEGMIYLQVHKSPPKPPKVIKTGISTDKKMRTTYKLYKQALLDMYGSLDGVPDKNLEYLNELSTHGYEMFVNQSYVKRNTYNKHTFYNQILAIAADMTNENLPLYPSPTKDCSWDCSFRELCIAMEHGDDINFHLDMLEQREESLDDVEPTWKLRLQEILLERSK